MVEFKQGLNDAIQFKIENVNLWWPHSMGKSNLQQIKVDIGENEQYIWSRTKSFGFRKTQIVEENLECSTKDNIFEIDGNLMVEFGYVKNFHKKCQSF